jgi:regulator of protease activity HflC (stomatin/prohibitin superfamily)
VGILLIQAAGFGFLIVAFVVLLFVIFLLGSAVRIVNEYERGVIFRLGRVQGKPRGRGLSSLSQ